MATTTQEYTLHLPQSVIELLSKAAEEQHESPDEIAAEALWFALDPVRQDALQRLKTQVRKLESKSEPEIRTHLDTKLGEGEQQRLSQLLDRNRAQGLTAEQQAELERLFERIEAVATEKAAAIQLLSGRSPDCKPAS